MVVLSPDFVRRPHFVTIEKVDELVGALADIAADYSSAVAHRAGYLVEHMAAEVEVSVPLDRLEQSVADATTPCSLRHDRAMASMTAAGACSSTPTLS